jgi:tetratricopeptide (TPR) repeat protein
MEIQAMKAGRRPVDQALVEALFASNLARIQDLESSGRLAEAFLGYVALAAEFKGLKEVSEFERKGAQLEKSKAVKKSFQEEKKQESLYQQVGGEIFGLSRELENPEQRQASLASLRRAIGGLRKKAEGKEDSGSRRVARWVLESLFVQAYEKSRDLRERKNYPLAAAKLEVSVAIHPERPLVHYYLAGAYASSGNQKKALAALQKAVETGFRDAARMKRDPSWEGLRREAAFQQILEEISRPQ